ncbi:RNA pseudouridine synthase [Rhodocytophaga aerolata]|uniref:RNA pseudouridine synthase n=1 Tax=Rhodocytophaga aerolata TaxID=455078 RepID=A0ABT8R6I0_9BACT|nr:RNA pseudouridine synthase [Rhodocytophaga aerolata]MDO1447710.1 RNA pseudouridine synthase [Rhodocytophaga aerolata]
MPGAGDAFRVVYEDNHLIVVNKRSGILVQGDKTGDVPLLDLVKSYIKEKYNKPGDVFLGTVHRLDRPVSGLVVFARTSKALQRMNELFKSREIKKIYWAVVTRKPAALQGELVHWLVKNEQKNITTAYAREVPGSLQARLHYRLQTQLSGNYLLEVNPVTGRPHQIRVQLASMGCPIRGDSKYGGVPVQPEGRIYLHARQLEFIHPVKKEQIVCMAPLPEDVLWKQFEKS